MKKLFTILLLAVSTASFAQVGKYVSTGVSYSAKQLTYGAEAGVYGETIWFGGVAEFTKDYQGTHYTTYVGPKVYYKLGGLKSVDVFGYTATKVALNKAKTLQFEQGFASVLNLNDKCALQFNMSLPVYEDISVVNPSVGLGINFYF